MVLEQGAIEKLVYELYGLTEKETEVVEGAGKGQKLSTDQNMKKLFRLLPARPNGNTGFLDEVITRSQTNDNNTYTHQFKTVLKTYQFGGF